MHIYFFYQKMSYEIKTNPSVPLKRLCECLLHEYYHCNLEFAYDWIL